MRTRRDLTEVERKSLYAFLDSNDVFRANTVCDDDDKIESVVAGNDGEFTVVEEGSSTIDESKWMTVILIIGDGATYLCSFLASQEKGSEIKWKWKHSFLYMN
jgi:hypothetical protein